MVAVFHHFAEDLLVEIQILRFVGEGHSGHVDRDTVGLIVGLKCELELVCALAADIIHDFFSECNGELGLINLEPLLPIACLHQDQHLNLLRRQQTQLRRQLPCNHDPLALTLNFNAMEFTDLVKIIDQQSSFRV